jgi:carbamoyl-phosphate synthase large subunit
MNVIRALRRRADGMTGSRRSVIGLVTCPLHAASAFCDYILPCQSVAEQVDIIHRICREDLAEVVMVGHSTSLLEMAVLAMKDAAVRSRTLLPAPAAIGRCDDKLSLYDLLSSSGISAVPAVALSGEVAHAAELPAHVKARCGRGSAGAEVVGDRQRLIHLADTVPNLIVQPLMTGTEVTVDYLADRRSRIVACAARQRLHIVAGKTTVGRTCDQRPLLPAVRTVARELRLKGAGNIQVFITPGRSSPLVFDVNPRFAAGGLMLSAEAGVNIPVLLAEMIIGGRPRCAEPMLEVTMMRYETEVFIKPGPRRTAV